MSLLSLILVFLCIGCCCLAGAILLQELGRASIKARTYLARGASDKARTNLARGAELAQRANLARGASTKARNFLARGASNKARTNMLYEAIMGLRGPLRAL